MIITEDSIMQAIENGELNSTSNGSSNRKMPPLTPEEETLLHYGVLGMRWSHHKRRGTASSSSSGKKLSRRQQKKARKAQAEEARQNQKVNERARENEFRRNYEHRDQMSTKALQAKVKRLQIEQQYQELVNKPAAERAKAAKALKEKQTKRNKMIVKTALSIYGNMPAQTFGKNASKHKSFQDMAKTIAGSDVMKQSIKLTEGEVIKHYGVMGMHWGTHKGKRVANRVQRSEGVGVKSYLKSHSRSLGNSLAHPLISAGVRAKNTAMHPVFASTSPFTARKKNNMDIRTEVLTLKNDRAVDKAKRIKIKGAKIDKKLTAKAYDKAQTKSYKSTKERDVAIAKALKKANAAKAHHQALKDDLYDAKATDQRHDARLQNKILINQAKSSIAGSKARQKNARAKSNAAMVKKIKSLKKG